MIEFQVLAHDRRYFVHKKLLRTAVGFIPGGSTALQAFDVARGLVSGGGGVQPQALAIRQPSRSRLGQLEAIPRANLTEAQKDEIITLMFATRSWQDIGRAVGMTAAAAQDRYNRKYRPSHITTAPVPSSIPPPNPLRERNLAAKTFDMIRLPLRPRERIPFAPPRFRPTPVSLGAPPMIHARLRRGVNRFLGGGDECLPGQFKVAGVCVDPSAAFPGGDPLFSLGPDAVMGRFGSAYVGNSRLINRTTCLPGDLVGRDGLCYNRKSLTNKERMWPRGRQPLLTGGEMRAISIAARAAGKFERTQKRLQKIGMLKKPAARARAPKLPPHQHQITSGG